MSSARSSDGKIRINRLLYLSVALILCLWIFAHFFEAGNFCLKKQFQALGAESAFNPKGVVDVTGKKIKAFILIGQSNMVGRGRRAKFDPVYIRQEKKPRVFRLYPSGWGALEVFAAGNGPEVSFAHAMAAAWPDADIGIIKVAIENTGIRGFIPSWDKEQAGKDASKGPIYRDHIRPRIRLAKKLCPDIEFAGVLWKQGGKDMRSKKFAQGYTGHLTDIINELRKDTGVDHLPLFVGTYVGKVTLEKEYAKRATVKAVRSRPGMYDVLKALAFAEENIAHTKVVVHGYLPVGRDGVHFNTEGQTRLGKLFADSVLKHYGNRCEEK